MVRRQAAPEAGEAEGVVANAADPVLGVPVATPFDAEAGAQGMVHGVTEEFARRRRLCVGLFHSAAEEQFEFRAASPKLGGGREGEVELQAAREQKDPVDARSAAQVKQVRGVEFVDQVPRPVFEHAKEGQIVCDGEAQVKIRPTIPMAVGERSKDGSADEARVGGRQPEHMLVNAITVFNGEHGEVLAR
ncbi:MAG TPA: hypothetical protein VFZ76_19210 [Anaerolineales bacterium]